MQYSKPIINKTKIVKGIMKTNDKSFGFIKVEDGTDMFVLPSSCANFGHQLPAVGTKLTFRTVIDAKTNKIRLEAVTPQDDGYPEATTSQHKHVWSHPQSSSSTRPKGA